MSHPDELLDADFEAQLRGLFQQAERAIEGRAAAEKQGPQEESEVVVEPTAVPHPAASGAQAPPTAGSPQQIEASSGKPASLSLPQMLKPVVLGLEAVSRATTENTALLKRMDSAAVNTVDAAKHLPTVVADLRALVEAKNGLSQSMFAALHEELKGYKDGFLLDSVHRPIIRDLISLYDDTAEIHRQVSVAIAEKAEGEENLERDLLNRIRTIEINLEHHMEFISEVLNRLEVTLLPQRPGKLDKRSQRAIAVEMAENPDEDGNVIRVVKRGFLWKERIFRAEEVVIKKWKEGFLMALSPEVKR